MLKLGVKKAAIYFDIDRTLIDAAKLREYNRGEMCKTLGLDREKIFLIIDQYERSLPHKNDFCREDMIREISLKTGIEYKLLKRAHDRPEYYVDALYDDIVPTLTKLKNDGCSLGIYSEGFIDYQMDKLKLSGIDKYFNSDKIIIVRKKLREDVVEKLGEAIVIDDWVEVINYLKQFSKITPIWLNRAGGINLNEIS